MTKISAFGQRTSSLKNACQEVATEGAFGYLSLDTGRPETKSEGWIYCMFESGGAKVARFNLSWLLEGQDLSKLRLPEWAAPKKDN